MPLPLIALTLGDVAGIGPEVVARACADPRLHSWCRPLAVGHPDVLRRAAALAGVDLEIDEVSGPERIEIAPAAARSSEAGLLHVSSTLQARTTPLERECSSGPPKSPASSWRLPCWNPAGDEAVELPPGRLDARAGEAAYQCLVAATRAALAGQVDAVTTAPLNKAALHLAGRKFPGHTEILAGECGVREFAMMLYLPHGEAVRGPHGLGVAHVTLHTSIANVPGLLTTDKIVETIRLIDRFLRNVDCPRPRIGVCALNPHAGEEGLFGDEESRIIAPAVATAERAGIDAAGPFPADTLLRRAVAGEFDGIAAMYHDQGHIALKLIGFDRAVNVTLGLPIVRTSPSHGTAFDIAGQGRADAAGMLEAVRIAALLARHRQAIHVAQ